MLKVDLITVGKLKEDYLRRACEEYQKRLGCLCQISDHRTARRQNAAGPFRCARSKAALHRRDRASCPKSLHSPLWLPCASKDRCFPPSSLPETFLRQQTGGISQMSFIIGGSWGLDPAVKQRSNLKLSMSRMTFRISLPASCHP